MEAERRTFFVKAGVTASAFAAGAAVHAAPPLERAADRALWISWYDLPEDGRAGYLAWLHGSYLPQLLKRPGFMWAAHYAAVPRGTMRTIRRDGKPDPRLDPLLPAGDRYILMFGAGHANVFGDPAPGALHAGLAEADRKMLALRAGERVNIMVEAASVDGPEAKNAGPGPAPCIQLGNFNCAWQDEEDMLAWYAQSRMPAMTTLPGSVRTRRLASVSGWAKHAILYEFTSLEARNRYYVTLEDGRPEARAWADRIVPKLVHAPGSATLATRLWPA